jgi:hypothetical protein
MMTSSSPKLNCESGVVAKKMSRTFEDLREEEEENINVEEEDEDLEEAKETADQVKDLLLRTQSIPFVEAGCNILSLTHCTSLKVQIRCIMQ